MQNSGNFESNIMEGLLKFRDLEEHFANSTIIIDQQNGVLKGEHHLEVIVSQLTREIQILKESEQTLRQQLKTFSRSPEHQDDTYSLYVNLKDKYNKLQDKYDKQEKEKVELEEKQKWEKNEITEDFVRQMKVLEEVNEYQKTISLKIQRELSNEMIAQQASADIRYDEMESNLQSQIRDINKKLHDSVQSCNTMRQELFSLKTCSGSDIDCAKKRIQELERELRLSKQQLQLTEEKLLNTARNKNVNVYSGNDAIERDVSHPRSTTPPDSDRPSANIVKNKIIVYNENPQRLPTKPNYVYNTNKYMPLISGASMEQESLPSEEFPVILREKVNMLTEPLRNIQSTCGSSRYNNNRKQNNNNYSVPPLKQLTVAPPKQRKRKLYNPDNFDYLQDLEPQE